MNRSDVVRAVANQTGYPITLVERVITNVLDITTLALAAGEEVNFRKFGKFEPRPRKAVTRRNPLTGASITVPEKVAVGFVPSPALKDRVNANGSS